MNGSLLYYGCVDNFKKIIMWKWFYFFEEINLILSVELYIFLIFFILQ